MAAPIAALRAGQADGTVHRVTVESVARNAAGRLTGAVAAGGDRVECGFPGDLDAAFEGASLKPGAALDVRASTVLAHPAKGTPFVQIVDAALADGAPAAKKVKVEAPAAAAAAAATPAPAPAPAAPKKGSPQGGSPPAEAKVSSQPRSGGLSRRVAPIASLNPYNSNWTIRARVASKGALRTFNGRSGEGKVLSFEIVDEEGSTLEVTAWHAVAERLDGQVEEGKVYYFSKGQVKPNNKKYSSTNNDYQMTLGDRSGVEECLDADVNVDAMKAALQPVAIGRLAPFAGSRQLVDILAVATEVGPLGSVKRKKDNTELQRRDITLADKSGKTVTMTLWSGLATDQGARLEALTHPVVAFQGIRVSDFNGISLSTLSRTRFELEPETPEAAELRQWWAAEGATADLKHAGEGLASAQKAGGRDTSRKTLADLQPEELPAADAKPVWSESKAFLDHIIHTDREGRHQRLMYMAAPDGSNKKVIDQGGGQYFCEATQKAFDTFQYRYIFRAELRDASGRAYVNVYNDEAEAILGMTADDLAALKEADEAKYTAVLEKARGAEFALTLKVWADEWEGKVRRKMAVQRLKPLNYVSEAKLSLAAIKGMLPQATAV